MAQSSAARPLPRGCAWPCLAVGVSLALLGLGSLLGLPKCWVRSQQMWTEVPGSVVESYLKESQRNRDSEPSEQTYDVRLKYRYRVDDRDFTGEAYALRQPKHDNRWDEAKAVRESYRAGDDLPVFYNPTKASASRLTQKEPGIEFGKDVLITLLFLFAGAVAMLVARAILHPKQSVAPS